MSKPVYDIEGDDPLSDESALSCDGDLVVTQDGWWMTCDPKAGVTPLLPPLLLPLARNLGSAMTMK